MISRTRFTRWLPAGLRPRLMLLIAFTVGSSMALMVVQAARQRDAAIGAAAAEAALMSRLAAVAADNLLARSPRLAGTLADFDSASVRSPAATRRRLEHLLAYVGSDVEAGLRSGGRAHSRLPGRTAFLVVDRRGRVVAQRPPLAARRGDSVLTAPPLAPGRWIERVRGGEGHPHIVAFAPLPGAEPPSLYVGVSLDRAEIVAGARREFANNLAVLLLVGAIVAVVAWFGAQAVVVRRVEALVGATERLREGDLSARTGLPYGRGELSVLSRAFDVMAAALERGLEARERDEARLRASEAHKSAVLEAALDGLMVLDGDGVLLEWNPAARRLFGAREPGDSRPRAGHLLPGLELPGANEAGDGRRFETVGLRADGTEFPVEVGLTRIAGRAQFVATVRDLTERKRWERSVEALTFVDDLTGLFNRRGFSMFAAQQLRLAARSGQRVVIVSADVDGLKAINDTYGHAEGDRAIIEMAVLLRRSFRETDVVARFGGDEFVVLATETESNGADSALERLVNLLELRNSGGGTSWPLRASFGWIRTDSRSAPPLGELIARADARMYEHRRAARAAVR
ncbi:MAG: diguanylate cyclase [Candidatus Eisenbacteria bacterium]|nr:diguanylate cyclase [Candidatus Eisenbacteria bacterium]